MEQGGVDSQGKRYASRLTMWEEESGETSSRVPDPQKKQEWYSKGVRYWEGVEASVEGVLGGYGIVNKRDITGSNEFLTEVFDIKSMPKPLVVLGRPTQCLIFKSRLQEYAQKAGMPAPVYDITKEGLSHRPLFKAKVTLLDETYESPSFYKNLKKAEHAAAEVALKAVAAKTSSVAPGPLHESGLCKNLLQEYAQKCKLALPAYILTKSGEAHSPLYTASVEIAGVRYKGSACKSKKEAEIKAARTALLAILTDKGGPGLQAIQNQPAQLDIDALNQESGSKRRRPDQHRRFSRYPRFKGRFERRDRLAGFKDVRRNGGTNMEQGVSDAHSHNFSTRGDCSVSSFLPANPTAYGDLSVSDSYLPEAATHRELLAPPTL